MVKKLDYVRVYYSDGHAQNTSMNPNLTNKEIREYFKVGRVFNVGNGEHDKLARVTKVIIYRK